jgi:NADH-quinone oxidoreductase subunit J
MLSGNWMDSMIGSSLLAQAATAPLSPLLILLLAIVAGVGTVLLLPSASREASMRKIGGALLIISAVVLAAFLFRWAAGSPKGGMNAYFWIFSAIALVGAMRVVTHSKPVYSALYFVLTVFATAGLFLLLWAEFMAAALVLIYAGAILVTYVFVIMLAAEATPTSGPMAGMAQHDVNSRDPVLAATIGLALMALLIFVVFDKASELPAAGQIAVVHPIIAQEAAAAPDQPAIGFSTKGPIAASYQVAPDKDTIATGPTQQLDVFLFNNHLINLELAGLILTLAMIGAIVIARRRVIETPAAAAHEAREVVAPMTPIDDNPHSIPVVGTDNPRQKAYPET